MLQRAGWQALVADGVEQAREAVRKVGAANLAAVMTDLRMPQENGVDLVSWLRAEDASLAVIVMTADPAREAVQDSLRSGAWEFLEKPVRREALVAAAERAAAETRRRRGGGGPT